MSWTSVIDEAKKGTRDSRGTAITGIAAKWSKGAEEGLSRAVLCSRILMLLAPFLVLGTREEGALGWS